MKLYRTQFFRVKCMLDIAQQLPFAKAGAIFQNSELTLSNVLVPGIEGAQTYDAVLNFTNGTFVLTTATPLR